MISSFCYQGFYYLEVDSGRKRLGKSIAYGVMANAQETAKKGDVWGYLVYNDVPSERQRIVPLEESPIVANEKFVECIAQSGERFRFSYIDVEVWQDTVRHMVYVPPGMKELTTTKAVQEFFLS